MSSSLVIQTSFLGDVVLTTPLIAELARRGPVDALVTPSGATLLANNPSVRRLIIYDKRGRDHGVRGLQAIVREVAAGEDGGTAYLAQGSWRSAMIVRAAGYRERVGFDRSAGRWLYTRRIRYRADRHHAERLWRLAGASDASEPTPDVLRPRLYPSAADQLAVDVLLAKSGHGGDPLIAVAPGSVWATKRWPYYPELAGHLADAGRLVVIGSVDDRPLAAEIVRTTGGSAIDATGRLSLLASAALIGRCVALITNDSAPQHLASAMGTPTVSIFGPTVPEFGFGPIARGSTTVGHQQLPCRPCDGHGPMVCPLGHWRCMRDLDAERVLDAVLVVLRRSGDSR